MEDNSGKGDYALMVLKRILCHPSVLRFRHGTVSLMDSPPQLCFVTLALLQGTAQAGSSGPGKTFFPSAVLHPESSPHTCVKPEPCSAAAAGLEGRRDVQVFDPPALVVPGGARQDPVPAAAAQLPRLWAEGAHEVMLQGPIIS